MHKYEIVIFWRDQDQKFISVVPELDGCSAFGEDPESALRNVQEAMDLWLDVAQELGEPIPEPTGRSLLLPDPDSPQPAPPA